jgi:hypothetical protein
VEQGGVNMKEYKTWYQRVMEELLKMQDDKEDETNRGNNVEA